eukprot:TRINITY_DN974_c0_g1_i2.p1 TRINITY_DN974_c0_g1~~TRINITY_DN974_c0_g1_i2.p1  ORF type:complete len:69 (+),score=4.75 TRINITY_DN974_c0_g1_i2:572-778(+)
MKRPLRIFFTCPVFVCTCHMALIQNPLDSPDAGARERKTIGLAYLGKFTGLGSVKIGFFDHSITKKKK